MIWRPSLVRARIPRLDAQFAAPPTAAQQRVAPTDAKPRMRLNLKLERVAAEGVSRSDEDTFVAAFQARLDTLAHRAAQDQLWSRFMRGPRSAIIGPVAGGALPAGMSAKQMGEHAATAVLGELHRLNPGGKDRA
jgi:hypothetical protein